MKRLLIAALLMASPAVAQDFSEGSTAKSWGLFGEEKGLFEAKVVDILCELTGDCPENCGDGRRQLGLIRAADDVLVFPNKNSQAAFTGAAQELLPYCGQNVEVDGLLLNDADIGSQNIYQIQKIRAVGDEKWKKANTWTKKWAKAHPEAKGKGAWFRRDPRIKAAIEEGGYLGLGQEFEAQYVREYHQ